MRSDMNDPSDIQVKDVFEIEEVNQHWIALQDGGNMSPVLM